MRLVVLNHHCRGGVGVGGARHLTLFHVILVVRYIFVLGQQQQQGGDTLLSLHGSGTTNPAFCLWNVIDKLQDGSKVPIRLTYRAVGSGTGQAEFVGNGTIPDNDFACADIPLNAVNYTSLTKTYDATVLHLPFVLGAISFFHSVPDAPNLNLTSCLIARILQRQILSWDHADIVAINPFLQLPSKNFPITVAHRVLGSSSTASITGYLRVSCPEQWPDTLVGSVISWPSGTLACDGSQQMAECIRNTPGTIGYIDSGHGHDEQLVEIKLRNKNGNYLNSQESMSVGGVVQAVQETLALDTANGGFPDSITQDFSGVSLLDRPGESTWPIVAISYIYVRGNLTTFLSPAKQTLLKTFLQALYQDQFISDCETLYGFVRVPTSLQDLSLKGLNQSLTIDSTAPNWTIETKTIPRLGQADYVISTLRQSYSQVQRIDLTQDAILLEQQVTELQAQLANVTAQLQQKGPAVAAATSTGGGWSSKDDSQLQAALVMASLSIVLWGVVLMGLVAKIVLKI